MSDEMAPQAPQGRPVLRPGADPFALLESLAAQIDATQATLDGQRATLTALAACFGTAAPAPPSDAPAAKQPPKSFGQRSAPKESPDA